jgi:hypothetical protein
MTDRQTRVVMFVLAVIATACGVFLAVSYLTRCSPDRTVEQRPCRLQEHL